MKNIKSNACTAQLRNELERTKQLKCKFGMNGASIDTSNPYYKLAHSHMINLQNQLARLTGHSHK